MRVWLATVLLYCTCHAAAAAVVVNNAWARATPPGNTVGVVYGEVVSQHADELVSITSEVAERVEIHTSVNDGGTMRMRPLSSVTLSANQRVLFQSGGMHVMLIGLRKPLVAGTSITLTLKFRSAPAITVRARVVAPTESRPSL